MTKPWQGSLHNASLIESLRIEDMEGEVVLLGFDVEVVVADAVSLVEDEAGETCHKDHRYADSQKAEAHDLEYIAFRL